MRLPLNLASEPFRKDRPLVGAGFVTAGVLAVLWCFFAYQIYAQRLLMRETREGVERMERDLRSIHAEQAKLDANLRQPENAAVFEQNVLLNQLIARKGISWTRLFADLERLLPGNVRLISVRLPQINSQNEVLLDMVVGSEQQTNVLELIKRLEASPLFGATTVHSFQPPSQNENLFRYRVSVSYAQKL
jgi:type IV pilus assembly protein PilN